MLLNCKERIWGHMSIVFRNYCEIFFVVWRKRKKGNQKKSGNSGLKSFRDRSYIVMEDNMRDLELIGKINKTIVYCKNNVEFYQRKYRKVVGDEGIKTLEEFEKLPFTTKDDVKQYYPFGFKGADIKDIVAYNESSGTSSGDVNRSSRSASFYTQKDVERDIVRRTNGDLKFNDEDIVFVALPYALTTSGLHFHIAASRAGAMVINADNGSQMANIRKQIDLVRRLNPSVIITSYPFMMSTMMNVLGVQIEELSNLRAVQLCGMSTSREGKRKISQLFNGVKVYDTYGMSEFGAITSTCDCGKSHIDDDFYIEIINPKSLDIVGESVGGEIVITTFDREGSPKLRYRTGDVGKMYSGECKCGRKTPTIEVTGRLKDLFVIDGKRYNLNDLENVLYENPLVAGMYKPMIGKESIDLVVDIIGEEYEEVALQLEKSFLDTLGISVKVTCVAPGESRKEMFKKVQEGYLKSLQNVEQDGDSDEWLVTY